MGDDNGTSTPAYVGYGTFKNQISGLDHVPSPIDYSVFSTMGGSTRQALFKQVLRFFRLIDEKGTPSDHFKSLASGDESAWRATMKELITSCYTKAQLDTLKSGTIAALKQSFSDHAGPSVVPPACRFLIAAAKDIGMPVSGTIEKSKVGGSGRRSKPKGGSKSGGTPRTGGKKDDDARHDDLDETPGDMMSFPIHIPGKPVGRIVVPKGLSESDLVIFDAMVAAAKASAKQQD